MEDWRNLIPSIIILSILLIAPDPFNINDDVKAHPTINSNTGTPVEEEH